MHREIVEEPRLFPVAQETTTSDDYWTPAWIFDALGIEFDLDVACPPDGPPHTPAKAWYTQETDGLASPWFGRVWMNPPFSNPTPWVQKFMAHANGICLVPTSKGKWFNNLWHAADAVVVLPSNLKFDQGGIFLPTILAALGSDNAQALRNSGIGTVR
jgi:phage N-6-adenine-methyltransferase